MTNLADHISGYKDFEGSSSVVNFTVIKWVNRQMVISLLNRIVSPNKNNNKDKGRSPNVLKIGRYS